MSQRVILTFGSRQGDGTRKYHEMARKHNMILSRATTGKTLPPINQSANRSRKGNMILRREATGKTPLRAGREFKDLKIKNCLIWEGEGEQRILASLPLFDFNFILQLDLWSSVRLQLHTSIFLSTIAAHLYFLFADWRGIEPCCFFVAFRENFVSCCVAENRRLKARQG